jgi:hypothetical protein
MGPLVNFNKIISFHAQKEGNKSERELEEGDGMRKRRSK